MRYGHLLTWETMHALVAKMLETAVQCLMEPLSQTPLWGRVQCLMEPLSQTPLRGRAMQRL